MQLTTKSQFNSDSPVLTAEEIAEFNKSSMLKTRLRKSFLLMLDFYGISATQNGNGLCLDFSDHFQTAKSVWLTSSNKHNFLRISRMITSLSLLGLKSEAAAFLKFLEDSIYPSFSADIAMSTLNRWKNALKN